MANALSTAIIALLLVTMVQNWKKDATDSPTERSGLILYTDHGTWVQYVGTPFGGVTPRLDKDGKPVLAK
jgi:hypothetical protein